MEIENWNRSRNAGEQHGSDVNIWLVSDLGLIITSDQHCQFLCRMPYNLQNPQIPLSLTGRQEGRLVSLIFSPKCVVHMCIENK